MVGCSLINCNHALSNMAPSDLDSQYLGEMLHGSWTWLIKIGTVCYPNILKFLLKIQNLIVTPHSSLWYLRTAISSWIPAPAGFNEESLRVRGRRVNSGQDHAASPAWAHEKFVAEVGLWLPLNAKGSCGQRTLIRRLLKPQGSAPEHSHKRATGSLLYQVCPSGKGGGVGSADIAEVLWERGPEKEITLIALCPASGCAHWLVFIPKRCEVYCKSNLISTAQLCSCVWTKAR